MKSKVPCELIKSRQRSGKHHLKIIIKKRKRWDTYKMNVSSKITEITIDNIKNTVKVENTLDHMKSPIKCLSKEGKNTE